MGLEEVRLALHLEKDVVSTEAVPLSRISQDRHNQRGLSINSCLRHYVSLPRANLIQSREQKRKHLTPAYFGRFFAVSYPIFVELLQIPSIFRKLPHLWSMR
jgi:hypothetical protein